MKLLMVMYGRTVGGAEMQFIELANYLAQRYKVRLISLGGDGSIRSSRLDSRIEVRIYHYTHGRKGAIYLMLAKSIVANLAGTFDAVISTSFFGDVVGLLLSVKGRARSLSLQTVSKCIQNPRIDRFILKQFDYLVAGAGDIRDYLIRHGQSDDRIQVIHNWVDFSARQTTQSAEEVKAQYGFAGKQVIGCIGRLHPQKGQIVLVRAFAQLIDKLPEHVLVLVGDGDERAALESEAEHLKQSSRIFFLGGLSGENYNNIYNAIDIYVQPSIFEGLPRTMLDAMYMGKAIIASDANGNREAIKHGMNGFLVPPQDVGALAEAIFLLAGDPAMRAAFARQAAQDARAFFGMQEHLKKIEAIVSNK